MLCSILLPTRARPEQLLRTIGSIQQNAEGEDYEILLRMDEDDSVGLTIRAVLEDLPQVRLFVGDRCDGYVSLNSVFYRELEEVALGDWCWIMNDDAVLDGKGWDTKLAQVPLTGYIIQPGTEQLNDSVYHHNPCTGFPCYRRGIWKEAGFEKYPDPCDYKLPPALWDRGYRTWFLDGITVHHQRGTDAEQAEHRRF